MVSPEWLVVAPGSDAERSVPIEGRLLVGRECAGIEPERRLILDDLTVSRIHLEVRVAPGRGAELVDLSTNGTRLNGRRVDRADPTPLADGDRIRLGDVELEFRSLGRPDLIGEAEPPTLKTFPASRLAIVVGDLVGYSALTELHGGVAVAEATDELFTGLRELLDRYQGVIWGYAGDSMCAAWEADEDPDSCARAVAFALAANEHADRQLAALTVRGAAGDPLRMGWAVTLGETGTGRPGPTREQIHGDAVNLAFRLSGLAAREGRAPVLVSAEVAAAAPVAAHYGPVEELSVRGRVAPARVHAARTSQL